MEDQKPLDHVEVQLYSGDGNLLLNHFDIQFRVQVSGVGSATLGMCLYHSYALHHNVQ